MKNERTTEKRKKAVLVTITAVCILLTIAITVFVGRPLVEFASKPEAFREWVNEKGILSRVAFILMVIVQTVIALIPGEPFEIVAGYAFGAVEGTLLCLLASALGSALVILLVRKVGVWLVRQFFSEEKIKSLKFLQTSKKREFLYLLVFMIPGTPKDLLCYFAGLTNTKLPVLFIITSLGRIPSIITSTIGGDALGDQNYIFAIIVFVATLLISGAGLLIYNAICKKNEK